MTQLVTTHADGNARPDLSAPFRVGLIGHGISLSRTPRMHMEAGAALGLDYDYALFDTDDEPGEPTIAELITRVEAAGLNGVNVTHPFKQDVIAHLDVLSDAARAVNAVNTVVFKDGKRYGHNTDYWGYGEAFRRNMADAPKTRVLLIGAGGAGGAVANALADAGVGHLVIHDVDSARAEALSASLAARQTGCEVTFSTDLAAEVAAADGLVNATPVGMAALPGTPVPTELMEPRHWVSDIIYFPLETAFLAHARALGCRTLDGSGMAVFQAVRAFELFTGVAPDPDRMRATFDAFTTNPAGSSGA